MLSHAVVSIHASSRATLIFLSQTSTGRSNDFLLNFPPNNAFVSAQDLSQSTSWVGDTGAC